MPRRAPPHPTRSGSNLTGGPPSDASKSDDQAVEDVMDGVEKTGSIDATARKLALYAKMMGKAAPGAATAQSPVSVSTRGGEEDDCAVDDEEEDGDGDGNGDGGEGGDVDMDRMGEDDVQGEEEVMHLQEVVEGLWVGDLVAAMDTEGLKARGITNILSLLRPKLRFDAHFSVFPLEIDDSADTDILTHLPTCVAWIGEALRRDQRARRMSSSSSAPRSPHRRRSQSRSKLGPSAASTVSTASTELELTRVASPDIDRDVLIRHLPQTHPGGVLVHCQAGMSRSATVAIAYLMTALSLDPSDALSLVRSKRPVVDPSDTFWHQLALFYNADGRVSLRDRDTRQFYMERTTTSFMNRGGAPDVTKMAKYPATPTASSPPTPAGSHGRRKIRCRVCRRHLAVREHMMDHILDQSPVSRPRTPSLSGQGGMISSMTSMVSPSGEKEFIVMPGGGGERERERRPSVVSDVINPLTGLPGARSRHGSMSADRPAGGRSSSIDSSAGGGANASAVGIGSGTGSVPVPRAGSSSFSFTAIDPKRGSFSSPGESISEVTAAPGGLVETPKDMTRSNSYDSTKPASKSGNGSGGANASGENGGGSGGSNGPSPTAATPARRSGSASGVVGGRRAFQSADQLASNLPPQLAALRMAGLGGMGGVGGMNGANDSAVSSAAPSPPSSPERDTHLQSNSHLGNTTASSHHGEGAKTAARRMSMLALTPTAGGSGSGGGGGGSGSGTNSPRERRGSGFGFGFGGEIASGGPPILVNPKCSGYFVEPLTWMEPVLASGQISGKLVCPNEKCGAKIGTFDWAGVQCGCKEWVTPGFCIHRSKVDEVW